MSALVVRNLSEEALAEIERLAEQNGVDPGEQAGRMLAGLVSAAPPGPPDPLPTLEEGELLDPPPKTMGELLEYLDKKYPNAGFPEGQPERARGGAREVTFD